MILGIDASNIRAGGGVTHLISIINHSEISISKFDKIIIWSSASTLKELDIEKSNLLKKTNVFINKGFILTAIWQILFFKREAIKMGCDIVFVPGGTFLSSFSPFVTMSQNMLPFERKEIRRFKSLFTRIKFYALHITQSHTLKKAQGIIFLTKYAKDIISTHLNLNQPFKIVPHGIDNSFKNKPKKQLSITDYSFENPFRLLYVSIVTAYKHQWNVAEAVSNLRKKGLPLSIDFIGPSDKESLSLLMSVINRNDPNHEFLKYHGKVNHASLPKYYKDCDAFIFASSCENMPIILIEAMTAGLPIACSIKGPMPEVLGSNGVYFDPENIASIQDALNLIVSKQSLREAIANGAYNNVNNYTWKECAISTFNFLEFIWSTCENEQKIDTH